MKTGALNSVSPAFSPSFGRKLRTEEKPHAKSDIQEGLNLLGKSLTVILPTTCSPSYTDKDTGVGRPYSACAQEKLYPFLSSWCITGQQTQPMGLGKQTDASPYVSNSTAYNTSVINLETLTKPESGSILSEETYQSIVNNNPKKGQNRTAYLYNVQANKTALDEAYQTFVSKKENLESLDETERAAIEKLDADFEQFKKDHGDEQEKNALYYILSDIHNNDYWPNWGSETDKNLFSTKNGSHSKKETRLAQLRKENADDINSFLFSQMLAKKTIDEGRKQMEKQGIKTKGDIPVANSDPEVWANKDLFLEDMRMGCKEPWNNEPQRWGFFVLDPNQLFNEDGTLGKAGQFLYDKYEKAFEENRGGVRIDHIVGLMDPYVYNEKNHNHQGRLYSELYKGTNGQNCDRILRKIVIPAAKKAGLSASNIIAEDLGYMPGNSKQVLNELGIGGISVTQWMKGSDVWNAPANNAIMIANHDTATAKELYPDKNERKNKFIELFASGAKNVQVFWTDLFGIKERYNMPGVTGDENWSLRMTQDFEDTYHRRLENEDALNIPEAILEANRRRDQNFDKNHRKLAQNLQHWSNVLKEKE